MVSMTKKSAIAGLVPAGLVICMLLVAGCTSGTGGKTTPAATSAAGNPASVSQTGGMAGSLKLSGSTTVLPVAQKAAEAFMKAHNDANIQVSGGGSGVGVQAIGEKTVDIGMSSRDLTAAEIARYQGLVSTPVALDGIAVIVNPDNNPVNSLTLVQIRDIYNGTVTNWKDVGGRDMKIVVIGRDSASGTRTFFTDTVMNRKDYVKTQLEKNSNGAIQQSVAQTPGAIGYVGLGYIDPTVKALKISVNGSLIGPSTKTVLDKSYPISRSLLLITNGQPSGLAKSFIDYILSPDGQEIVKDEGFVPLP
jgi:phosphate transport system substrate-binding protein